MRRRCLVIAATLLCDGVLMQRDSGSLGGVAPSGGMVEDDEAGLWVVVGWQELRLIGVGGNGMVTLGCVGEGQVKCQPSNRAGCGTRVAPTRVLYM